MSSSKQVNIVLFVGRVPKCWKECLPLITERIVRPLENLTGLETLFFSSHHCPSRPDGTTDDLQTLHAFIKEIKPSTWHAEDHKPYSGHDIYNHHYPGQEAQPLRALSKLFHNANAFSLCQYHIWQAKGSIRPRWVLLIRPDTIPYEEWNLPATPERDALYVPKTPRHYNFTGDVPGIPEWTPDQLVAGDYHTMQRFCAVYHYIFRNMGLGTPFTPVFVPEYAIHLHLERHWGVRIKGVKLEYDLHSYRREQGAGHAPTNDPSAVSVISHRAGTHWTAL